MLTITYILTCAKFARRLKYLTVPHSRKAPLQKFTLMCIEIPPVLFSSSQLPALYLGTARDGRGRKVFHLCLSRLLSSPLLLEAIGDRTQHNERTRRRHRSHQVPPTRRKSCARVRLTILRRWIEGEGSCVVMLIAAEIHFSRFCPF